MIVHTPAGVFEIVCDVHDRVCAAHFLSAAEDIHAMHFVHAEKEVNTEAHVAPSVVDVPAVATDVERGIYTQIKEYFLKQRTVFTCPIAPTGTAFSMHVWNTLTHIEYGRCVSYSTLALQCGTPRAVRAVAHAVASNPISILIPCHRVIRKDGTLGEYAAHTLGADGRNIKKYLFNLEHLAG